MNIDSTPNRWQKELDALTTSLSQSYEELALLHRISDSMQLNCAPVDFFNKLAPQIHEVLEAETLLIFWEPPAKDCVDLPRVCSVGSVTLSHPHLEIIWDRTAACYDRSPPVLLDGNVDRPNCYTWPDPIRTIVGTPVSRHQRLLGAVVAVNKLTRPDFDSLDIKLLHSVSGQVAIFLENYRLYQDLQDLFLGSLRALTSSVDAKDPYTCGHSERVALIAQHLSRHLHLAEDQINNIYLAGLLHDVGKIGVDEAVLCKPGRLTDIEFAQVKKHPQIGADILRPIRQMESVTQAVLAHHERFDGGGYPHGLAGRKIPLTGRIMMLADSFDAMVSDRTYRRALPVEAALAEIRRFSGTQFDPELADIFMDSDIPSLVTRMSNVSRQDGALSIPGPTLQNLYLPVLN